MGLGQRRVRCRHNKKRGFFWNRQLSECGGCTPEEPAADDTNVSMSCSTNARNVKKCLATCPAGMKIQGGKKLNLKCRCPKQADGNKVCGWIGRNGFLLPAEIQALTCTGTAATTAAPTASTEATTQSTEATTQSTASTEATTQSTAAT